MNKNDKASLPNPNDTYKADLEKKLQTVQELLHFVDAIVWSNPPKSDIDDSTPKDNIQIDFPPIGVSLSQSQLKESCYFMRVIDDKRRKRFIINSNGEKIPYKRTYDQSQTNPSTARKKRGRPRIHSKEEIMPPPLVLSHVLNVMIKEILTHITSNRIHMRKLSEDIYRDYIKPLGVLPPETVICYDYIFNILYRLNLININEIPKPSTSMNSTLLDESLKQLVRDGNISALRQFPANLFNQAMSYIYLQSSEWKMNSSSYPTTVVGNMIGSSSSASASSSSAAASYSDMSLLSNDQTKLLMANEKIAMAGNLLSTGAWIYRESNLLDWSYSDVRQWDVVPEAPHRSVVVNYNVGLFVSKNTEKKSIHYNHFHTLIAFYTYQFKDPLVLLLLEQILEACLKDIWNVTITDDSSNFQISEMKTPRITPSQISIPLNIKPNNNLLDCFLEDFNQDGNRNLHQQPTQQHSQQQPQQQMQFLPLQIQSIETKCAQLILPMQNVIQQQPIQQQPIQQQQQQPLKQQISLPTPPSQPIQQPIQSIQQPIQQSIQHQQSNKINVQEQITKSFNDYSSSMSLSLPPP